ncbi:MAG: M1 family aminopeptidase [Saprospiraceae bacterium]|jgi:hypothetical protein|nr:M1 family aminopeptidase [Saprospiraceae bacterium]
MFPYLLKFEAQYQSKQKFFFAFSFIFAAFGFIFGSQGFSIANVDLNAAYQISNTTILISLSCVFAIMFFCASGMLRDRQYKIESILYSTSVSKRQFFFSRFLGVFGFSLLVMSMSLVGMFLGFLMPNLDPKMIAPINFGHYFEAWLMIVLPNIFICTSLIFMVCTLTKNNLATYFSAIFIYALYWVCAFYFNSPMIANATPASPENMVIAALADPFGISAFFEQTQYWTPFQKNTQSLSLAGNFFWNRILWISIGGGCLAMTYQLFSFRTFSKKARKKEMPQEIANKKTLYSPVQAIVHNSKFQKQSFFSLFKMELSNVFKSLPFLGVLLIWVVLVFSEIYLRINQGGDYNQSLYPTTNLMIWLIKDPLPLLSLILIVFYSGEMVWRERSLKFNEIIDATPASNTGFFLSKSLALVCLPILLITISIIMAMGFQISKGYFQFEIGLYLSMFYYLGIGLFFYVLLAFFIQSLIPNKYGGMVITGLIILFLGSSLSALIGIEHPLFRIGRMPRTLYSNMDGYGDYAKPFHYHAVYWISLGFLLSVLSFRLWQRGTSHKVSFKLKQILSNWTNWQKVAALFFGSLFIISGTAIFYNTNIVNEYSTYEENLNFREAYERKYEQYQHLERLYPISMKTEVDLFPNEKEYRIKADYILANKSDTTISHVLITDKEFIQKVYLENAKLVEHDTFFDTRLYEFEEPILPRQEVKFTYELIKEKKGFDRSRDIVKNGSFMMHSDFEPALSYRSSLEIADNFEREKRGLPKRIEEKASEEHLHEEEAGYGKLPFETIVSTEFNQIAIAPGNLIKQWKENNRAYFHYKTPEKIIPFLAYFSGEYKVHKEEYKGITIEQYYHPSHDFNISTIAKNSKLALDYCINNFVKYPFDHLRIVEMTGSRNFAGLALPGTIGMVEDRLYLIDNRDPKGFDLIAKRTIHEVAHQWWGHLLSPKHTEGGGIFTEGLAKYTEVTIMEKVFGKRAAWQLSETANNRYFKGRSYASEHEPPLYLEDGQGYLLYGKNYTVLLAMKTLIGEEKINLAIQGLFEKHKQDIEPNLTSIEWLEALYEVTRPEYHVLIDDWFKRVITYNLKTEKVIYEKLENGDFEITISISAKRFETMEAGDFSPIQINEPIQIGAFTENPRNVENDEMVLYLESHQIDKEKMNLKIITKALPKYIAIDPFGTRLDENRKDNISEITDL